MFNVCICEANSILAGWKAVRDINIQYTNDSTAFGITLRSLLSSSGLTHLVAGIWKSQTFANRSGTFKASGCFGRMLPQLEEL